MISRFTFVWSFASLALFATSSSAQAVGPVLVRHAPSFKGSLVGSIQVTAGESMSISSGASVSGDLRIPGTPTIILKTDITYGGTQVGAGIASPSGYTITINSNSTLGHLVTRTDPVTLPAVGAPPAPAGTRSVTIKAASNSVGSFSTLRNLTLENNVGQFAIPGGTYGNFTANTGSGFTLGVAGAATPALYNFQNLTLNGASGIQVLGPVIITVANGFALNGTLGTPTDLSWLSLNIYSGNLTVNGGGNVYGAINAPNANSLVTINSNSQIVGSLTSDKLALNSGGVLRVASVGANAPPTVSLTAPINNSVSPALTSVALRATAADSDGTVAKVEFFNGTALLGQSTVSPYGFIWNNVGPGSYILSARATDNRGAVAISSSINLTVVAPPVITSAANATGQVGVAFSYQVTASDSPTSYSAVGLPPGLNIDLTSGAISGTPLSNGTTNVTIGATNGGGTGTATLSLTVNPAPPVFTSSSSASGQVGSIFNYQIIATNATAYSAAGLPSGLTIDTATGLISGTPARPGKTSVVISATNSGGTISATVVLTVLASLPYVADFEPSEGYSEGLIEGQLGWSVLQGAAVVTPSEHFSGTASLLLVPASPASIITQTFAPVSGAGVVFADLFAKPVAETSAALAASFTAERTKFAFQQSGGVGVLYVYSGDGAGGASWLPTPFSVALGSDNRPVNWTRLTARADFVRQTWDLYANGQMVAADLKFFTSGSTYLSIFQAQGSSTTASGLDDLYVGTNNPLFADINNNGIDDAWEFAHGLSLSADNRDTSPSGSGVTVVQAYIKGTDPNDFFDGATPTLTILGGNNQVGSPGQFNAQPFDVGVWNSAGTAPLVNAPVTFSVTQGGGSLASANTGSPTLYTTFTVRTDLNGSVRLYYLQPPAAGTSSEVTVTAGAASPVSFLTQNSVQSTIDSDGNGLSDAWEQQHFGQLGIDPDADPDGDGLTNFQEYQSGTDPNDYFNDATPEITVISPEGDPDGKFEVSVHRPDGTPYANAPVTFDVSPADAAIAGNPDSTILHQNLTLRTDANGIVRVYLRPAAIQP